MNAIVSGPVKSLEISGRALISDTHGSGFNSQYCKQTNKETNNAFGKIRKEKEFCLHSLLGLAILGAMHLISEPNKQTPHTSPS